MHHADRVRRGHAVADLPEQVARHLTRGEQAVAEVERSIPVAGTAIVLATHDAELVAAVADRVVRVERGRAVDTGSPRAATAITLERVPAELPA